MPLNLKNNPFDDFPGEAEPIDGRKRKPPTVQKAEPKRKSANRVSCTFHLEPALREQLQSLAFVLRTTQTELIDEAIRMLVEKKGVRLPKRAA